MFFRRQHLVKLGLAPQNNQEETIYLPQSMRYQLNYNEKYVVYGVEEINNLLDIERKKNLKNQNTVTVRFLVRPNGTLVFGEEGSPSGSVPAHFQLSIINQKTKSFDPRTDFETLGCLSSGNAYFNDQNEIYMISNKSGDYHCPPESIASGLDAFSKHSDIIKFTDTLEIEALSYYGPESCGTDVKTHTLKTNEHINFNDLKESKSKIVTSQVITDQNLTKTAEPLVQEEPQAVGSSTVPTEQPDLVDNKFYKPTRWQEFKNWWSTLAPWKKVLGIICFVAIVAVACTGVGFALEIVAGSAITGALVFTSAGAWISGGLLAGTSATAVGAAVPVGGAWIASILAVFGMNKITKPSADNRIKKNNLSTQKSKFDSSHALIYTQAPGIQPKAPEDSLSISITPSVLKDSTPSASAVTFTTVPVTDNLLRPV